MKHSLRPLVQLSIPPILCSPTELKFDKICITPTKRKEEWAVNLMLPRPYHPSLATLPTKHASRALAAVIHTVIHKHVFNSKESPTTIFEEFQIAQKKLYEAMTGKHYNPGMKLMKAEKAQKEAEAKLKKLKTSGTKEDQDKETAEATSTSGMMDRDMPELISEDDEDAPLKKFTFKKPPSWKPPHK